jgi:rfaE bifunctional protein kinase chain/domain
MPVQSLKPSAPMTPERFQAITEKYARLRLAVVGDFCLDRYLEIDPGRAETSIETSLPVHNVMNVRSQPGGAGTIVNNLAAIGAGEIFPVGFSGEDGEGYELGRALAAIPGVRMEHFIQTNARRTFTYCKPLIVEPGRTPRELNRLDQKNWTPTPATLSGQMCASLDAVADKVDALILLSQVDQPETGVLTKAVLETIGRMLKANPRQIILADSRRGLTGFPPVVFKMNAAELAALAEMSADSNMPPILNAARDLARRNGSMVFVTLAERGMVGATPDGRADHVPAQPLRGEIDVVGAGDAVTANLTAALSAGADLREALELASAAASIVIHQLGTTGSASASELRELLFPSFRAEISPKNTIRGS